MRGLRIAVASLALAACAQLQLADTPSPQSDWGRTLFNVRRNVGAGNYSAADRVLDEFVRTHPNTPEAREIAFWRAAYLVDPANERGSLAAGIAALDSYLAADSAGRYRDAAIVLRRTAAAVRPASSGLARTDSTASAKNPGGKDTVALVSGSREEEIALLRDQLAKSKDELAKVTAELERIKKRLANPSR